MYMMIFKLLLPFFLYAGVTKIVYDKTGGRGGNTEHLVITRSLMTFIEGHGGKERTVSEKTNPATWRKLVNSISIPNFNKIKSNPGHSLYDGIDITISVTSNLKEYSIVNGNEDSINFKRIKKFNDQLEALLSRLRNNH